jgi:RNA 3'-terminal phosphate cyclase (ATP)
MGVSSQAAIERWGFYPKGGGKIQLKIDLVHDLKPIFLAERGLLKRVLGISAISNLPKHVAERQREQALRRVQRELKVEADIAALYDIPSNGPGSFLFLLAEYEKTLAAFSSLGARGKPAEKVADEAVDSMKDFMKSDGCIDPHLADQLVPFMALAKGTPFFTTTQMTQHLLTNLWVIGRFLGSKVRSWGEIGRPGKVEFLNE